MVSEILTIKGNDYNALIKEASAKIGVSISSFLRLAAIEKAKKILSDSLNGVDARS